MQTAEISLDTSFVLFVAMGNSKSDFNAVVTPQTLHCVLSSRKNIFVIQIICNKKKCSHCVMKILTTLRLHNDL